MRYNSETREVTMTVEQAWGLRGCVDCLLRLTSEGNLQAAATIAACGAAIKGAANLRPSTTHEEVFRAGVELGHLFNAMKNELIAVTDEHGKREVQIVTETLGDGDDE